MHIIIDTPNGRIKIKLVDNKFITDKWLPHFEYIISKYKLLDARHMPLPTIFTVNSMFEHAALQIRSSVSELIKMNTGFPYDTPSMELLHDVNTETQLTLNKLHRSFTNCMRTDGKFWDSNNTIPILSSDVDTLWIKNHAASINNAVHTLESFAATDRKKIHEGQLSRFWFCFNVFTNIDSKEVMDSSAFKLITQEDYNYVSDNEEYDVWLGTDILGKDHVFAYFDHDDPTEWDITVVNGYTGKIEIDTGISNRARFVKTEEFGSWLEQHGLTYHPAMSGIPIGTVVEGKKILMGYPQGMVNSKFSIQR